MFCTNCGQKNNDGAKFCAGCGCALVSNSSERTEQATQYTPAPQYNAPQPYYAQPNYAQPNYGQHPESYHKQPKCTHCGHIGEWDIGPVIRPIDWVIGICLLFFFGGGLIYLVIVAAVRSNKDRREKICRNCKAKNLFTFNY
ncbi:MAG: zinc ribbon domain-containing protein [Clostridia bacterium]|nr:zinc ribbon domain-containing protein [Clostridia bacterium]